MKALFFDWNDTQEGDDRVRAYRAKPDWPMPDVGERIAVGHENCFYEGTVERVIDDKHVIVHAHGPAVPVPLGWPHDDHEAALVEAMNRERRFYLALKRIASGESLEPGTSNPSFVAWWQKLALDALGHTPTEGTPSTSG